MISPLTSGPRRYTRPSMKPSNCGVGSAKISHTWRSRACVPWDSLRDTSADTYVRSRRQDSHGWSVPTHRTLGYPSFAVLTDGSTWILPTMCSPATHTSASAGDATMTTSARFREFSWAAAITICESASTWFPVTMQKRFLVTLKSDRWQQAAEPDESACGTGRISPRKLNSAAVPDCFRVAREVNLFTIVASPAAQIPANLL